jgi:hypothetical protein
MQASQTPTLVPLAFAANGTKNTIPENSQISITPGAASLNDGFPPLTFTPIAAGGVPPAGADFNGVLNLITQTIRWSQGGGMFGYNSAFATDSNVGGYPRGALLLNTARTGLWLNATDNNATNPDTGGAGWSAAFPAGVVGQSVNLTMSVTAASATATLTADEIIVETALGGQTYRLASFSKTINLATTGAGGMDTGTAPVSGYVALYAIYNPTTGTSALLATNATSVSAPEVYGGANRPAGYTASALVSVWNTNGSGQFVVAVQLGRCIDYPPRTEITISTATSGFTQSGTIADIPLNARFVNGSVTFSASTTGNPSLSVAADASGSGTKQHLFQGAAGNYGNSFSSLKLTVARAIFFALNLGGATGTATYFLTGYEF